MALLKILMAFYLIKQDQGITTSSKKSKLALGAHPTSYSTEKYFFRGNKTARKWSWPHTLK